MYARVEDGIANFQGRLIPRPERKLSKLSLRLVTESGKCNSRRLRRSLKMFIIIHVLEHAFRFIKFAFRLRKSHYWFFIQTICDIPSGRTPFATCGRSRKILSSSSSQYSAIIMKRIFRHPVPSQI